MPIARYMPALPQPLCMHLNTLGKYLITNTNTQTTNTITQNLYLIAIKYKYVLM